MLARLQTLRPLTGKSATARWPMVSDTTALSVLRTCAFASTLTDSASAPTFMTALVRVTWLFPTSTPVALNVWKPASVIVISYVPLRTNWML